MSDIGILNGPFDLLVVMLIIGSPGFVIGGIAGALLWRRHRIWGALAGAVAGLGLWLLGWLFFTDSL